MYRYDDFDAGFVAERVAEFRDQVARRLSGELTEEEFKPLRLMNGVYLQLHAYMLRDRHSLRHAVVARNCASSPMSRAATTAAMAISPRGRTSSSTGRARRTARTPGRARQRRDARHADLAAIASATSPPTSWPAPPPTRSRIPRPYAEMLRQWSSLHPEFSFLPRKFKIAVTARRHDRAAVKVHDIGYQIVTQRGRRDRLCGLCRRRPGPHAVRRAQDPRLPAEARPSRVTPRRSCACTISKAGATTNTRRASRSWSTKRAPRRSATRSRRNSCAAATARPCPDTAKSSSAFRGYFALPDLPARPVPAQNFEARRAQDADFAHFAAQNVVAA